MKYFNYLKTMITKIKGDVFKMYNDKKLKISFFNEILVKVEAMKIPYEYRGRSNESE